MARRMRRPRTLRVSEAMGRAGIIDAYTTGCLEQGCSQGEMTEAVHVSCAIRGG